jgi:hypothetical protein
MGVPLTGLASIRAVVSRRLLIFAALAGLLAASCADLPEAEVSFGEGVRFVPMVADATDNVGLGNSLAVDADGNPYISYFGFPSEEGSVAASRPINSAFLPAVQLTTVADGIFVRGAVAQAQDPPSSAYVVPFGPEALTSLEDLAAENANGTSVTIDAGGQRHVAWSGGDGVWYAGAEAEGSFAASQVDVAEDAIAQAGPIGPASVAVDDEGEPWVAYQVVTARGVEVRVATPDTDGWATQVAATTELCNGCPSPGAVPLLVVDGSPVALFADPVAGEISQATLTGNRWVVATAVAGVEAIGLAAASDGETAYASFYAGGSINVASGAPGAAWSTTEVAEADVESADRPTSDVALDDEGTVYVAWQDPDGVHMAAGAGDGFEQIETQQTERGTIPSVAVTGDGANVYLAWYDTKGQDLLLGVYGDVGELALANPSPIPPPSPAAPDAGGECGADGQPILEIASAATSFTSNCLVGPSGEEFTITYDNPDAILHNIAAYTEQNGDPLGDNPAPEEGPTTQELTLGPLDAGSYYFQCDVHPTTMQGTLAVAEAGGGGGGGGNGGGTGSDAGDQGGTDGGEADATPGSSPTTSDAAA